MSRRIQSTVASFSKSDDTKYPRSPWLRVIRWILKRRWPILIIGIAICTTLDISLVIVFSTSSVLLTIADIATGFTFVLPAITVGGRWAQKDQECEKDILNERSRVEEEGRRKEEKKRLEEERQRAEEKRLEEEKLREKEEKLLQRARERQKKLRRHTLPPGFQLTQECVGQSSLILSLGWSPDGNILASGSRDNVIRLWNTQTGNLLNTLGKHTQPVYKVAWSPDARLLASCSGDTTIRLWDASGHSLPVFMKHPKVVFNVVWSPDSSMLASGSEDATVRIWDADTGRLLKSLTKHSSLIGSLAWSPDGSLLASGSDDNTVRIWSAHNGDLLHTLTHHSGAIFGLAWSPDGHVLASCSGDTTIRLWDARVGRHIRILEGHTDAVFSLSFSANGRLLASKSADGTVRLWRTETWNMLTILDEASSSFWTTGLAFHPQKPIVATLGKEDQQIRIWELDMDAIFQYYSTIPSVSYANAKVVLLGDSGVGKSGLGLVLSGKKYEYTDSSHGRHIWTFDTQEVDLDENRMETRETLLWDMAGQPGYRLIHQLYLNEVAVALVVFDAHSETDPFAGVQHWSRALYQAHRVQESSAFPLKKFLVAARIDRGGVSASRERIQRIVDELHFDGWFQTSAREGWQIAELKETIRTAIDWKVLPHVTSTELFQQIKDFLNEEKKKPYRLLSASDDLYSSFIRGEGIPLDIEDLPAQFEICIRRLESLGLIRRFSFGKLILLQPELLDAYATALIHAVMDEPDGLGCITEERVREGDFRIPTEERLKDKEQEKLLLIAMVEDLLRRELVLREESFLVFPSQSTRENPDLPDPEGKAVVFDFEGPVLNIYATLAVRLANSGLFKKNDLWRNAITYRARAGGTCGIFLRNIGEGCGELTLFFDKAASGDTRSYFEDYVVTHLQRRALPESVKIRRVVTCSVCNWIASEQTIRMLTLRESTDFNCPICQSVISLVQKEEQLTVIDSQQVLVMDRAADKQRELEVNKSKVEGKRQSEDFDVFLCYNSIDRKEVEEIAEELEKRGILPWFAERELRPGMPWQRLLEKQIGQIKSAAVFVGSSGVGPWQQFELEAFLREFVSREPSCPVIPVMLKIAPQKPQLPRFLASMTWVDFRLDVPDPMDRLVWGITGERKGKR